MLEGLKKQVCQANLKLNKSGLVIYNWGNVSGIDRDESIIAIKPSGVSYDDLTVDKIVLVDIDGNIVEGDLNPSSDTATHLELYRNFADIAGICHSHSNYATIWAQACIDLPCMGTTHADYFYGAVPATKALEAEKIANDYELNTAKAIVERFAEIDPAQMPAVLVANHGPFTWGDNPNKAVDCAVVLEYVAKIAFETKLLNPAIGGISNELLDKHFLRKHGKNAYYGQNK